MHLRQKSFITGVRTGCHYLISLSMCFGCGGISGNFAVVGSEPSLFSRVLIGPKSLFCFTPLHVILKFVTHTAARCCSSSRRRSRAAVHVESSDTMRARKAQCQAPPDNPEFGDISYHGRERSCAGEKIERQNL